MTITKFEDVKNITTEEYFKGNKFSIDAFEKKYAMENSSKTESYVEALKRVCKYIASAEKTQELKSYWEERWFDEIYNDWWHPAGSIMQGANSDKSISLSNCTTISMGVTREDEEWDSLEGIIKNTSYTVAKTAAYRQGLGVDFSRIRPRGSEVKNSSNESQGVTHWMKFVDSIGNYIGQKGRIPAMLFSLSIDHPDVIDFINSKSDYVSIQNANISVQTNNAFYKAVEEDADWEMEFKIKEIKKGDLIKIDVHSTDRDSIFKDGSYYRVAKKSRKKEVIKKKEKARVILELIAKSMFTFAEPGIQQIDMARYWSNSDYVNDPNDEYSSLIISSNACSEQYLSRDSLCVLSSINAGRFSIDKECYSAELKKIAYSVNRFLDNVNEMELIGNTYATPYQKQAIEKLRRTGAGITNMDGWLFKSYLQYGSQEANDAIFEFNKVYNFYLYESSISLGHEKGSFGLFTKEKFTKSPFVQEMMKLGLEFDAMRNVTCSSIAPTGTLSLMFRDLVMSYGVEPSFGLYFWKRTRISGKYEYYFCVPAIVRQVFEKAGYPIPMDVDAFQDTWDGEKGKIIAKFIDDNKEKAGIAFTDSRKVNALDKLDLMSKLMKYVDSSISVTYLLPETSTWKDVYDFIIEANNRGVKSIAAFPDKKMYGIISYTPFRDLAFSLKNERVNMHESNFSEQEKAELNIFGEKIIDINSSPKRQEKLDADIFFVTADGQKHIMAVGLQNNRPYEMFGGLLHDGMSFKKSIKRGSITKIEDNSKKRYDSIKSKSRYKLEVGDDFVVDDFGKYFTTTEQKFFRLISLLLRKGTPIKEVVEQLNESSENIMSLASAAARVLKKYIADGEKPGGKCPSCGGELVYSKGCVDCTQCEWGKCS